MGYAPGGCLVGILRHYLWLGHMRCGPCRGSAGEDMRITIALSGIFFAVTAGLVGCASYAPVTVSPRLDSAVIGDIPPEAAFRMLAQRTRESAASWSRYAWHCEFGEDGQIHIGDTRFLPKEGYILGLEPRSEPNSLRVLIYPPDLKGSCFVTWAIPAPYMKEWRQIMTAAMSVGMRNYCDEFECVMKNVQGAAP